MYRRRGERHSTSCVDEIDSVGLMVGVQFVCRDINSYKNPDYPRPRWTNCKPIKNVILRPVPLPNIAANRGMILAQDNVQCNVAHTTRQYLATNNIRIMPWPAKSLDLNPIEHILDLLKQRVRSLPQQPTLRFLEQNARQIGNKTTQQTIQGYILSTRKRYLAVIRASGGHAEYWLWFVTFVFKPSTHSFKRFLITFFYFATFKIIFLSLCIYYLGLKPCFISFDAAIPAERNTEQVSITKNLVHGWIRTTNTARPPDYKSTFITTRPQLAWYEMMLNVY